jgi:hypothetical protein
MELEDRIIHSLIGACPGTRSLILLGFFTLSALFSPFTLLQFGQPLHRRSITVAVSTGSAFGEYVLAQLDSLAAGDADVTQVSWPSRSTLQG